MAIFEVIKKDKNDDNLIWRYPKTSFNTHSQLIVHESQEALFFANGKALDLFEAGKYTLTTNNIPLLKHFLNISTGLKSQFRCEVYFIDKTEHILKWGTSSKIEFLEPKYKFPIQIGASGEMRFVVEDSRKLLLKIVGIKKTIDHTTLDEFFSSYILTKVKSYIANIITEHKISIFEIDKYLDEFSKELQEHLTVDFNEYGINLNKFFVTTILKPEDDKKYLQFKELFFKQTVSVAEAELRQQVGVIDAETKAKEKVISSQAEATKRRQEGYSYQEERSYDVSEKLAANEGVGEFTNVGLGLGIMTGVSTTLGDKVGNNISGIIANVSDEIICSNCGIVNQSGSRYCKNCGELLKVNLICASCKTELEPAARFCHKCGKKVK